MTYASIHSASDFRRAPSRRARAENGAPRRFLEEVVFPYEGDDCLIWPYGKNNGYARIFLDGRAKTVTRVICERVYGHPPTDMHLAAHSCGRGHEGCVTPRHLRWATYAENMADKKVHGTQQIGERSGNSKLTEKQVIEIHSLRRTHTLLELANKYGVTEANVSLIIRGKTWSHLHPRARSFRDGQKTGEKG